MAVGIDLFEIGDLGVGALVIVRESASPMYRRSLTSANMPGRLLLFVTWPLFLRANRSTRGR